MKNRNLYGMCYLLEERNNFMAEKEAELLKNLGVKTIRQWMHCTYLMKSSNEFDSSRTQTMHEWLKMCSRRGMLNIGLNHCNFNGGTLTWGKLKRDISSGSEYVKWLDEYYTTWYNLVKEFPEVSQWEVDNELNNPDFMCGINGEKNFSLDQMAETALDVMFYACTAIKDANPNAKVVLGGLTEPEGLGKGNFIQFVKLFYEKMKSGHFGYLYGKQNESDAHVDAGAYFDIMCWHPYVWVKFDGQFFIDKNREYYDLVTSLDGRHLPVYFTEMGFNDRWLGDDGATAAMCTFFDACSDLEFVETVNYYKMYDVGLKDCFEGNGECSGYGMFYDPDYSRSYIAPDNTPAVNGAPKKKAYAFQQMAGGSGSLTLLVK